MLLKVPVMQKKDNSLFSRPRMFMQALFLCLIIMLSLPAACRNSVSDCTPSSGGGENNQAEAFRLEIGETTAGRIGEWRIGVGNIFEDSYRDEKGRLHSGPVAGLYLYHPEYGEKEMNAYQGRTFRLGSGWFEVSVVKQPFLGFGKGYVVITSRRRK